MDTKTPNPGSDEAIILGCTCPVLDNAHGNGCGFIGINNEPLFWINSNCHLHNPNKDDDVVYKCHLCGFMTTSANRLIVHKREQHE